MVILAVHVLAVNVSFPLYVVSKRVIYTHSVLSEVTDMGTQDSLQACGEDVVMYEEVDMSQPAPEGWNRSRRALALIVTIQVSRYRKHANLSC